MRDYQRSEYRYTALFCEENVWWLARSLVDEGVPPGALKVLLFSNPNERVVLFGQRAAATGQAIAWDYHVVLQATMDGTEWVFDPDTRLPFPVCLATYLAQTFGCQAALPEAYRAWVRIIPGGSYLRLFASDRSHMLGEVPLAAFPGYPAIQPPPGAARIDFGEYRDVRRALADGSVVQAVTQLCDA